MGKDFVHINVNQNAARTQKTVIRIFSVLLIQLRKGESESTEVQDNHTPTFCALSLYCIVRNNIAMH